MTTLSVIVITKNAQRKLRSCLESVAAIADEIIVIDSGSTDQTLSICSEFTDQIFSMDWPGFGIQKQRALDKATSEWVLSLDADEVLTKSLCSEISKVISDGHFDGYRVPRRTVFYGKEIRFSDGGDGPTRLARRSISKFSSDKVHESLNVNGTMSHLKNHMLHYSVRSIADMINKMNLYTSLAADKKFKNNKQGSFFKAIMSALLEFLKRYLFKLGFLDGKAGFILCAGHAQGAYYRYLKLYYDYDHKKDQEASFYEN